MYWFIRPALNTVEDKQQIQIGHDRIELSLPPYQRGFLPLEECPEPVTRIELIVVALKATVLSHYTTRTGGSPTVHDTETLQGFKAANDCLNILAMNFRFQTTVVFSSL